MNSKTPKVITYTLTFLVIASFLITNLLALYRWAQGLDEIWMSGVFLIWVSVTLILLEVVLNIAIFILRAAANKFLDAVEQDVYLSEEGARHVLLVKKSLSRLTAIQIIALFVAIPCVAMAGAIGLQRLAGSGSVRVVDGDGNIIDAYTWPSVFTFGVLISLLAAGTILTWIPMTVFAACRESCCRPSTVLPTTPQSRRKGRNLFVVSPTNRTYAEGTADSNGSRQHGMPLHYGAGNAPGFLSQPLLSDASSQWGRQQIVYMDDTDSPNRRPDKVASLPHRAPPLGLSSMAVETAESDASSVSYHSELHAPSSTFFGNTGSSSAHASTSCT